MFLVSSHFKSRSMCFSIFSYYLLFHIIYILFKYYFQIFVVLALQYCITWACFENILLPCSKKVTQLSLYLKYHTPLSASICIRRKWNFTAHILGSFTNAKYTIGFNFVQPLEHIWANENIFNLWYDKVIPAVYLFKSGLRWYYGKLVEYVISR